MKKLKSNIEHLIWNLAGDSDQARVNLRATQVRSRYKEVIECVYPATAELFLAHTNNVYIMKKDGVSTLIVYVDESIYSAELNAQRELIKLKLLEKFGERIEDFQIYVSRGPYKNNHPFLEESAAGEPTVRGKVELSEEELSKIDSVVSKISDENLRKSFEKAMTADLERNKAENRVAE